MIVYGSKLGSPFGGAGTAKGGDGEGKTRQYPLRQPFRAATSPKGRGKAPAALKSKTIF